jgi:RNA polymerase sigma-70 factor (ECF subfamily)
VLTIQSEAVLEEQIGSAPAVDEADLIRAAQRGDQDAFEQLVRAYDQGVLRLALNLLRNPDDARDVYQEAFLRAYRNLHSFRFDCSFQTWVSRIATNVCLDQLRRRKVRREEPAVVASGDGHVDRTKEVPERSADGDPRRQLLSKELSDRIRQVLEGFTPRERTVFELRHYEGLRLKAIGDLMGTTEEAAKNCLFRVTQKMRTALGGFV